MLVAAVVAGFALQGSAEFAGEDAALAREWWVRAYARAARESDAEQALEEHHGVLEHEQELLRAVGDPSWRRRAGAFEALARAAEGTTLANELCAAARQALADPHPNVRAQALAVLSAVGAVLSEEEVARLAREPLASLRFELARALEFTPAAARAAWLARLGNDDDERVRGAARNSLCGLEAEEDGVGAARLALFASAAEEGPSALARFGLRLSAAPLDEAWLRAARAACAGREPRVRAVLEILGFSRFGRGDAALLVAAAEVEEHWEPGLARLFPLAGRSGSEELADAVLRALAARALPGAAQRGLANLLFDTLEPRTLAFLAEREARAEVVAALLGELGLRRDAWDEEECARWARPSAPLPLRSALLTSVAGAYTRSGDEGCARILVRFLDDPEAPLAARAFEVLCEARVPAGADEAALQAAYATLAEPQRSARLAWFSRVRPFHAFRADWIALGQAGGETRAAACELLGGLEGDTEVRAALAAWLAEDLAQVAQPGELPRPLEQRVQAELRALARVSAGAATSEFHSALRAALGRSTEIGKVAAAALGRTPAGREELAQLLVAGALARSSDRRTRIEACLALAHEGTPEARALACERLAAERAETAWDLRERMLAALDAAGLSSARAELVRLALAPALEPVERAALATLLAGHADESARQTLRALAAGDFDLEARRVAVRALAGIEDRAALAGLFAEFQRGALRGSAEELALLRGELLVSMARLEPLATVVCAEWLRVPRACAGADLRQRFAGVELAATDFSWRYELELARVLAHGRHALRCLGELQDWERLDGRLLLALGESLADEGDLETAECLLSAGVTALQGERDPEPGRLAWARAQRLALALHLGHWADAAFLAERTLSARREGLLSDAQWTRLFGAFSRAGGVDPDARVRAALWQARARLRCARGERDEAERAAGRAARECSGSRQAHEAQRELERDLARSAPPSAAR